MIFLEADLVENDFDAGWLNETVQAYVLVYSIDRKSSFRAVTNALEEIRQRYKSLPILLAGNKIDLERKRAVAASEVKNVSLTYDVSHFEISVALNHDVDDLLVGIVAEIKESCEIANKKPAEEKRSVVIVPEESHEEPDDFRAAIRRFSQRKKRQMGISETSNGTCTGKCTNIGTFGLFEKLRQWKHGGESKC